MQHPWACGPPEGTKIVVVVTPTQAGVHISPKKLDSRFRGNDVRGLIFRRTRMTDPKPGKYAIFATSLGEITCELFPQHAPLTVENFVGLAMGSKEFIDPKTRKPAKRPFYDGLILHRVIPNFMIQGGCPLGTGTGGPGYEFKDEFAFGVGFDKAGKLAMANAGPGTNGSQFFITLAPTAWLNNHHTIFGQVVKGQEIVERIAAVARDRNDRPKTPVVMTSVKIVDVP
jgi:peptidyl-prolyl cis-trans isomerase A (cyclophilin A)